MYIYLIKYNGEIIAAADSDALATHVIHNYIRDNQDSDIELFEKESIRFFDGDEARTNKRSAEIMWKSLCEIKDIAIQAGIRLRGDSEAAYAFVKILDKVDESVDKVYEEDEYGSEDEEN